MNIIINRKKNEWDIEVKHIGGNNGDERRSFPEKKSVVNYLIRLVFFNKSYQEVNSFLYTLYPYGKFGETTIRLRYEDVICFKYSIGSLVEPHTN